MLAPLATEATSPSPAAARARGRGCHHLPAAGAVLTFGQQIFPGVTGAVGAMARLCPETPPNHRTFAIGDPSPDPAVVRSSAVTAGWVRMKTPEENAFGTASLPY